MREKGMKLVETFGGKEDSDERVANKVCLLRSKDLSKNED